MNAGKFPTASIAVKQVGGSYYTVRKIIQELQYKSKLSSSDILKPTISFPVSKLVSFNYKLLYVHLQSHTSYARYIIFLVINAVFLMPFQMINFGFF